MSAPTKRDITVYAGDDYSLRVTVTDDAGDVVDVTAYSFAAEVRTAAGTTGTAAATATVDKTTPASGLITVRLSDVQTAALMDAGTSFRWDLKSTDGSGLIRTLLYGTVTMVERVTA